MLYERLLIKELFLKKTDPLLVMNENILQLIHFFVNKNLSTRETA